MMMHYPRGRELVLGVGAGIAAYKSCELLRRLQDRGFLVTVVPTPSSLHFVGKATWEALSHRPVQTDLWSDVASVPHIEIGRRANIVVIAPATADLISRMVAGRADDLLTSVLLSTQAPVVVVPAMHPEMWNNPATMANVRLLKERGMHVMEPAYGRLTGSDVGVGRFPETMEIIDFIEESYGHAADLSGRRIVITGGGTREPIDPVRYIGNRSSGKQAHAIAERAAIRGAEVTLIMGPNSLPPIEGVETIHIETAAEMGEELDRHGRSADALIMTAAVADARPMTEESKKIKKGKLGSIILEENPDLLRRFTETKRDGQVVVGFAAETESDPAALMELGREKLTRKSIDLIFVNDVSAGQVFGAELTNGFLLSKDGIIGRFDETPKSELADRLLDAVKERLER